MSEHIRTQVDDVAERSFIPIACGTGAYLLVHALVERAQELGIDLSADKTSLLMGSIAVGLATLIGHDRRTRHN